LQHIKKPWAKQSLKNSPLPPVADPGYPIALKDVPPDVMAQEVAEVVQHGRGAAAAMIAAVLSARNLFE
jgi:hypothetical protein